MKAVIVAIAALMLAPATALAAGPAPAKPVTAQFFTGRWFEIARTLNPNQKDCEAPTYDFAPSDPGRPKFVLTCRKGSPQGPPDRLSVGVRLPKGDDASRFRVTALGGLVSVDYVVLDHDEAYSWAMMTTSGGNFIWILSRRPSLEPDVRAALVRRAAALGYDAGKMVFPRH
jgi:apolipoprotein D and lipocalin family protein